MHDNEDDDWSNYESGPFCRHWSDMDCEICKAGCKSCGHSGFDHNYDSDDSYCTECDCKQWIDKEDKEIYPNE